MASRTVLLIDDEMHVRLAGRQTLKLADCPTLARASAKEALTHLTPDWPGVLVTDMRMPGMDGLELLVHRRASHPDLPVVLVTGRSYISAAVEALNDGAYDFFAKTCHTEPLLDAVSKAQEKRRLVMGDRALHHELETQRKHSPLLGRTPRIEQQRRSGGSGARPTGKVKSVHQRCWARLNERRLVLDTPPRESANACGVRLELVHQLRSVIDRTSRMAHWRLGASRPAEMQRTYGTGHLCSVSRITQQLRLPSRPLTALRIVAIAPATSPHRALSGTTMPNLNRQVIRKTLH